MGCVLPECVLSHNATWPRWTKRLRKPWRLQPPVAVPKRRLTKATWKRCWTFTANSSLAKIRRNPRWPEALTRAGSLARESIPPPDPHLFARVLRSLDRSAKRYSEPEPRSRTPAPEDLILRAQGQPRYERLQPAQPLQDTGKDKEEIGTD